MSIFIPRTPAANKSAEQHQEPSEQDSFNHLLYKVLRLTSEQVQDLNDWMKHQGIPNVHEVMPWDLAKTFRQTPLLFTLNTHLHPTNLQSFGWSFLFTCLDTPISNIFLNSRQIAYHHFSLVTRSGSHHASWKLCGSSGSDIVLVTKAISCNHSFKVFSSLTSANALISGSGQSACLVLAAICSSLAVWLLVLEATGSSSVSPTGGLCWFFCLWP